MSQATPAIQAVLAAEHRAVYLFGVLAARAEPGTDLREVLSDRFTAHQQQRDRLVEMIAAGGADPVGPLLGYPLPAPLVKPEALRACALGIERDCVQSYAFLVGQTTQGSRRWAAETMAAAGLAVVAFGGRADPLPGLSSS